MTKIKICGVNKFIDIEYVNYAKPDYIGFVFAKSIRQVDINKAYHLKAQLDSDIKAVGVFVNESIDFIKKCCDNKIIDLVQLSGDENENYISKLQEIVYKPIIKAIRVDDRGEVKLPLNLNQQANNRKMYPLFDTFDEYSNGGTGKAFNWEKIKFCKKPFFLAGGINIHNLKQAVEICNPYCVDLSSGVETDNRKDKRKIIEIVKAVREITI